MPTLSPRNPAHVAPMPSESDETPNSSAKIRPRWASVLWSCIRVVRAATTTAPGKPTSTMPITAGHAATYSVGYRKIARSTSPNSTAPQPNSTRGPHRRPAAAATNPPRMPPTACEEEIVPSVAALPSSTSLTNGVNSVPMIPSPTEVISVKTSTTLSARDRDTVRAPSRHSDTMLGQPALHLGLLDLGRCRPGRGPDQLHEERRQQERRPVDQHDGAQAADGGDHAADRAADQPGHLGDLAVEGVGGEPALLLDEQRQHRGVRGGHEHLDDRRRQQHGVHDPDAVRSRRPAAGAAVRPRAAGCRSPSCGRGTSGPRTPRRTARSPPAAGTPPAARRPTRASSR